MSHLTSYGAFALFLALRTHFTTDKYDFFRMHGKLRINEQTYKKRSDAWYFEMFAREYTAEQLRDFFVANLLEDKIYIKEMTYDEATTIYNNYLRRRQSLSYICADDMARVFDAGSKNRFGVYHDSYPGIVLLFMRGTISLETMVILDDFIGYTRKFDKHYGDDIIWTRISKKINKYRPFLKYDKVKMKNILKGIVNEQRETTKEIPAKDSTH